MVATQEEVESEVPEHVCGLESSLEETLSDAVDEQGCNLSDILSPR